MKNARDNAQVGVTRLALLAAHTELAKLARELHPHDAQRAQLVAMFSGELLHWGETLPALLEDESSDESPPDTERRDYRHPFCVVAIGPAGPSAALRLHSLQSEAEHTAANYNRNANHGWRAEIWATETVPAELLEGFR